MAKTDLTAQRLRERLHYDPDTGFFRWVVSHPGMNPQSTVGSVDNKGYLIIRVDYAPYKAHRLAWLYMHSEWPHGLIDHINRCKSDNRICNLRVVNDSENQQNRTAPITNTSGHKGIRMAKKPRKWKVTIYLNGKGYHFGYHCSIGDALLAREKGLIELHTHRPT